MTRPLTRDSLVGLLSQGRTEEALAWGRRGRELDPLAVSGTGLGWILINARSYEEAIREMRSVLAVRPDDSGSHVVSWICADRQRSGKEAIPVLEKVLAVSDSSPAVMGLLVRAYAQSRERRDALRILAELKKRKQAGYVPAAAFVNAYFRPWRQGRSIYLARASVQRTLKHFCCGSRSIPTSIRCATIQGFKDLVRRVGLAP